MLLMVVEVETANIYMHACKQIVTETHGAFLDSRVGILAEESLHRLDRRLLESLLRKVLALCRSAFLLGFGFGFPGGL